MKGFKYNGPNNPEVVAGCTEKPTSVTKRRSWVAISRCVA